MDEVAPHVSDARDALLSLAPRGGRNAAIDLREPGGFSSAQADQAHSSENSAIRAGLSRCRGAGSALATS